MNTTSIELLQAEIDGINDDEDSAHVQRLIASDQEAAEAYSELLLAAQALEKIPVHAPPEGMVDAVMNALPQHLYAASRSGGHPPATHESFLDRISRIIIGPSMPRLITAIAFGAVVGLGITAVVTGGDWNVSDETIGGTMGASSAVQSLASLPISADNVTGSIEVNRLDELVTMTISWTVDADAETRAHIQYPADAIVLKSIDNRVGASLRALEVASESISVVSRASMTESFIFQVVAPGDFTILVESGNENVVNETIKIGAGQ